jgi:predicted unusual protein kinase regulating ubiquinone biosynthesis (AarF/ABC1/UbiB family)
MEETKRLLETYHKSVLSAFVDDGLIHSDIHLGNAVQTTMDGVSCNLLPA